MQALEWLLAFDSTFEPNFFIIFFNCIALNGIFYFFIIIIKASIWQAHILELEFFLFEAIYFYFILWYCISFWEISFTSEYLKCI